MIEVSNELKAWKDCKLCGLCATAHNHVLGRGRLPADVVLLGEGPGASEDALGEAFVGPAGKLLSKAIGRIPTVRLFWTNLIACRPTDAYEGPNRQPKPEEIEACRPRLLQTLQESKARGVVLLGRLPEVIYNELQKAGQVPPRTEVEPIYIPHPSFMLRAGGENSPEFPRYCDKIRTFLGRFAS